MTVIYLIRHSKFNRSIKYDNIKTPLTTEGENIAKKKLNIEELKDINVLYSSEYQRCISTAKYIEEYSGIKMNITPLINERNIGTEENVPLSFWETQLIDENAKTIDGESRKDVSDRMKLFLSVILKKHNNKKIVLVTHAVAITFLLMNYCELLDYNYRNKYRYLRYCGKDIVKGKIDYCDIIKLVFDENRDLVDIIKM